MNLVFSTTGFQEFNAYSFLVDKDNLDKLKIPDAQLNSVAFDMCLHLIEESKIDEILTKVFIQLNKGGILKINCMDVYTVCQKVHRREVNEVSLSHFMYDSGYKNCLSSMWYIQKCQNLGMTKTKVEFDNLTAKLEFVK